MRGKLIGAAAVVAGLVAVAGCSPSKPASSSAAGGSGSASASAPTGSAGPGGTSSPTGRSTPRPTVAPSRDTGKPSVAVSPAPPVAVGSTAALTTGVVVTVGAPRRVRVTAQGPGEIAGPAVAVPVTVRNASAKPFDLGGLVVNAAFGRSATPAPPTDADPARRLAGALAPGATARGTYVFLAPGGSSGFRFEVVSDAAARILYFRA
jgi:hypothetical protein